jgi:formylmethanofuran dehydrogenase subunit B
MICGKVCIDTNVHFADNAKNFFSRALCHFGCKELSNSTSEARKIGPKYSRQEIIASAGDQGIVCP